RAGLRYRKAGCLLWGTSPSRAVSPAHRRAGCCRWARCTSRSWVGLGQGGLEPVPQLCRLGLQITLVVRVAVNLKGKTFDHVDAHGAKLIHLAGIVGHEPQAGDVEMIEHGFA